MSRTKGTASRECAPTPEDFSKLMASANNPVDRLILALAGILAMDEGMIVHFRADWVKFHLNEIHIPNYQQCDCSYCKSMIRQAKEHYEKNNNGCSDGFIPPKYWHPKGRTNKGKFTTHRNTEPRDFGWHPWAKEVITAFCGAYSKFPLTSRTIVNRLYVMCGKANVSHPITVHGLRSFALSNLNYKFRGDPAMLEKVAGWAPGSKMSERYVEQYRLKESLYKEKGLI